ncbi:MAG: DUF494 family protein [Ignavibacteriales bacterium]|jgi:uncharacterized protein Smg (DUF494 family)|nr:DUF494 family protein [Melioribacteraceae bacterium]RJP58149.1 MAG: DUF494 family protein [Ignavibacteriales bacterium]
MTNKIVEVLAKILDGLNKNYTLDEVSKIINKEKIYDNQTVGVAFSLVFDKVLSNKLKEEANRKTPSKNFRLLDNHELEVIGIDNYNYLIHLVNVGLLSNSDLEMTLEQIMMYPKELISKDDINWIILISLIDFNTDILPGSRVLLYSSDTIN